MKQLYNKVDKKSIAEMERVLFDGKIVVVQSQREAESAVKYLLEQDILGFDTETRPSFRKGVEYKVSLVQCASREMCFLFRLNLIGMPDCLIELLEDLTVPKVGLSLKDDFSQLHKRAGFTPGDFYELQQYVKTFGIEDQSLQKLYANVFGRKISKGQRLTNWEAPVLTEAQKKYAATDAWACIMLYEELERLRASNDYEIIKMVEPEEVPAENN